MASAIDAHLQCSTHARQLKMLEHGISYRVSHGIAVPPRPSYVLRGIEKATSSMHSTARCGR